MKKILSSILSAIILIVLAVFYVLNPNNNSNDSVTTNNSTMSSNSIQSSSSSSSIISSSESKDSSTQLSNDTKNGTISDSNTSKANTTSKPYTSYNAVAKYIKKYGNLPSNFITKKEAIKLGWNAQSGNLDKVAPGKSIGGDVFSNAEGLLPKAKGRIWHEADINYKGGFRGSERILFSSDGLIYKTSDHYKTFTKINLE